MKNIHEKRRSGAVFFRKVPDRIRRTASFPGPGEKGFEIAVYPLICRDGQEYSAGMPAATQAG
jgi:hypothetical protein